MSERDHNEITDGGENDKKSKIIKFIVLSILFVVLLGGIIAIAIYIATQNREGKAEDKGEEGKAEDKGSKEDKKAAAGALKDGRRSAFTISDPATKMVSDKIKMNNTLPDTVEKIPKKKSDLKEFADLKKDYTDLGIDSKNQLLVNMGNTI